MLKRTLGIITFICCSCSVYAHPLHLSTTTLDCKQNKHIIVAVKLFTNDLLQIIPNYTSQPDSINAYFNRHCKIFCGSQNAILTLQTISKHDDAVWLKFSTNISKKNTLTVSNSILFEIFVDQINLVIYNSDTKSEGYRCSPQQTEISID